MRQRRVVSVGTRDRLYPFDASQDTDGSTIGDCVVYSAGVALYPRRDLRKDQEMSREQKIAQVITDMGLFSEGIHKYDGDSEGSKELTRIVDRYATLLTIQELLPPLLLKLQYRTTDRIAKVVITETLKALRRFGGK